MKKLKTLDIGEVAAYCGLPTSTLRYYEEKGLIRSIGRNGLRRVFSDQVLEQLDFIALSRRAGFSLDEISPMFTAEGRFKVNRKQLLIKADELDLQIKQMKAVRDSLRHAAECPARSHRECSKFQRLLRLAGKDEARSRRK